MKVIYDYLGGASPWYSCAKSRHVWVWVPQQECWVQQQDPTPLSPVSPEASGFEGLMRLNVEIPMFRVRASRLEADLTNIARGLPPVLRFQDKGALYVALGSYQAPWVDFGVWHDSREPYEMAGQVPQRLLSALPQEILL